MISRREKQELKAALIQALAGKLPLTVGSYYMEVATTAGPNDPFLNVKVRSKGNDYLETYLEVKVKESI